MTARDADLQARVLESLKRAGMTDVMVIDGEEIEGYFSDDTVVQAELAMGSPTFDCREGDLPTDLTDGTEVEVQGHGTFRYVRREPDSSGRALVILGRVLP